MSDFVDDDGQPIFTEDFIHKTIDHNGVSLDVIETNGNIWLSAPSVIDLLGLQANGKGDHSRRLRHIRHPDIIKITDTPFRFTDGRRNRGSLISPRAVLQFAEGKTQGFNPIKANNFVAWMSDHILSNGLDAEAWSPAVSTPVPLEPVFHKVIVAVDEDEAGRPLDQLRPAGEYHGLLGLGPLRVDEIEFQFDDYGIGEQVDLNLDEVVGGLVIDYEDDFRPFSRVPRLAA